MRTREVAAEIGLAAALAVFGTGCGAMFNGPVAKISVSSKTPNAEVYLNGGLAGKAPASFVTNNQVAQTVTVIAPGYAPKQVVLDPQVKVLPIVLDVLWCVTIVGVAAPISDALLGTFVSLEPSAVDVALDPAPPLTQTAPVETPFAVGDIAIQSAEYAQSDYAPF
jgi:hypothetical protein